MLLLHDIENHSDNTSKKLMSTHLDPDGYTLNDIRTLLSVALTVKSFERPNKNLVMVMKDNENN